MPGSREQRVLMKAFEDHTGFEFMGSDKVRASDPAGFLRLWEHNVQWLRDLVDGCDYIDGFSEYAMKHMDAKLGITI